VAGGLIIGGKKSIRVIQGHGASLQTPSLSIRPIPRTMSVRFSTKLTTAVKMIGLFIKEIYELLTGKRKWS